MATPAFANDLVDGDAFEVPATKLFSLLNQILEDGNVSDRICDDIRSVLPPLLSGKLYISRPSRRMSMASTSSAYSNFIREYFDAPGASSDVDPDFETLKDIVSKTSVNSASQLPKNQIPSVKFQEPVNPTPSTPIQNLSLPEPMTREQRLRKLAVLSSPKRRLGLIKQSASTHQPIYEAEKAVPRPPPQSFVQEEKEEINANTSDPSDSQHSPRDLSPGETNEDPQPPESFGTSLGSMRPSADVVALLRAAEQSKPRSQHTRVPSGSLVNNMRNYNSPQPIQAGFGIKTCMSPGPISMKPKARIGMNPPPTAISQRVKAVEEIPQPLNVPKPEPSSNLRISLTEQNPTVPHRYLRRWNSFPSQQLNPSCICDYTKPNLQMSQSSAVFPPKTPASFPKWSAYITSTAASPNFRHRLQQRRHSFCSNRNSHIEQLRTKVEVCPRSRSDSMWSIPLLLRSDPNIPICFPSELSPLYTIPIPSTVLEKSQPSHVRTSRNVKRQPSSLALHDQPLLAHLTRREQIQLLTSLSSFGSLSFDANEVDILTKGHALSVIGYLVFKRHNLLSKYKINTLDFLLFCLTLEREYHITPYHNSVHAADVLHFCHWTVTQPSGAFSLLSSLDLFSLFIAAMGHDVGHPGVTADCLIARRDKLAVRYNDISPLESHHSSLLFKDALLWETAGRGEKGLDDHSILAGLTEEERLDVRKRIITLIMSTDMKQHFNLQSEVQMKVEMAQSTRRGWKDEKRRGSLLHAQTPLSSTPSSHSVSIANTFPSPSSFVGSFTETLSVPSSPFSDSHHFESDSGWISMVLPTQIDCELVSRVVLVLADISNMQRPTQISAKWVDRLLTEQQIQGDEEKKAGRWAAGVFDRTSSSPLAIAEWQLAFGRTFVQPFVEIAHKLLGSYSEGLRNIKRNLKAWQDVAEREQNAST
ncbi:putative cAMP-specific 3',5'-cyclic phosphodiesterase 4A [Blattamonas nauphoetae]|uniref:cAMP-specific 3',5'-cyclic phosphodiesterase 4A n=1 Tax=Blattamonas nauphoetae TaxID=2049346 RepID=A0ABQ9XQ14_9EUKA|nr:putative cAMP-specific 3',5'-cyclic phosphodiesterase 4A [Blattamonas nauphoetae]